MTLTKIVNGETVILSQEEEEVLRVEWVMNEKVQKENEYKVLRSDAYPSIPDQLDIIFHEGIDAWKTVIQEVKDRYPKPVV